MRALNIEKERTEFEQYALEHDNRTTFERKSDGSYALLSLEDHWQTWLAAKRAADLQVAQSDYNSDAGDIAAQFQPSADITDLDTAKRHIASLRRALTIAKRTPAPSAGTVSGGDGLTEVHKFLLGEAPLDGAWFSERHTSKPGKFWWRENLRAAIAAKESKHD